MGECVPRVSAPGAAPAGADAGEVRGLDVLVELKGLDERLVRERRVRIESERLKWDRRSESSDVCVCAEERGGRTTRP